MTLIFGLSWAGVTSVMAGVLLLLAFIAALARVLRRPTKWVFRHLIGDPISEWFRAMLRAEVEPLVRELQPNGGRSMKDRVEQIAAAVAPDQE